MNRRNLLSGLAAGLAALCGWKARADEPPPYRVIHTTLSVVGKTMHSCPKGGKVKVAVYRDGKPTGEIRLAHCPVNMAMDKWAYVVGDVMTGGEC